MKRLAFWMLAAFVASIPSENGIAIEGLGSLSKLLGVIAFGATALSLVEAGKVRFRRPSVFLVLALLLALWSGASYFWSEVPSVTVGDNVTLAQLLVMVWMVWQLCRSRDDTAMLMQAFVLGCYLNLAVGITTFLVADARFYRDVGGLNPNAFAIVAALGLPMAWYLGFYWRRGVLAWLNFIYPAFAMFGVVLAASRGGLLTGILALTVIPLTLLRLSAARRVLLFGLLALATWSSFVYLPQVYPNLQRNIERLSQTTDEIESGTMTGRTTIWQVAYDRFRDRPLLGIGFGAFNESALRALGEPKSVHNAYVAVAVERGLVALVLFLGMLLMATVSVVRMRGRERTFFLVLLAVLMLAMVPTNSENDKFSWFVLALLAGQRPLVLTRKEEHAAGGLPEQHSGAMPEPSS